MPAAAHPLLAEPRRGEMGDPKPAPDRAAKEPGSSPSEFWTDPKMTSRPQANPDRFQATPRAAAVGLRRPHALRHHGQPEQNQHSMLRLLQEAVAFGEVVVRHFVER